jgi:hypothetical protein
MRAMLARAERSRGSIEKLSSGALGVKAHAGYDPARRRAGPRP